MALSEIYTDTAMGGVRDDYPTYPEVIPRNPDTDHEITLQSFIIRKPEVPIYINDEPFSIEVEEDLLRDAANYFRKEVPYAGWAEPRLLDISYISGLHPKVYQGYKNEEPVYHHGTRALRLEVPVILKDTELSSKNIAKYAEDSLNRDLIRGLVETYCLKKSRDFRPKARNAFVGLCAIAGAGIALLEAKGYLANNKIEDTLFGAGAGTYVGFMGALFAKLVHDLGGDMDGPDTNDIGYINAYRKARNDRDFNDKEVFKKPIIKVVPLES